MLKWTVMCAFWVSLGGGCASIDGKPATQQQTQNPSGVGDSGRPDAGADAAATTGGQPSATTGDAATTGSANEPDAGGSSTGGGSTGAGTTGDDASVPPPKAADGTCSAPYELVFSNNKASVTGVTTGKQDTLSPKCSPAGLLGLGVGKAGPDQVYRVTMPFKGTISVQAQGTSGFSASTYLLTSCGSGPTEKACGFSGALSYAAAAGTQLFVYVDSGVLSGLISTPPTNGGYVLSVQLREESAVDGACGTGKEDPYCAASLHCRAGKCSNAPVTCGDGFVEGSEECDDMNAATGDGCAACKFESDRDTCANAPELVFRNEGSAQVARASSSTSASADNLTLSCGATADHVYSFTLAAQSSVTVVLSPAAGYDASLGILRGQCSDSATEVTCQDQGVNSDPETYSGTLAAGTYFVVVDGYGSASKGDYELTVSASP